MNPISNGPVRNDFIEKSIFDDIKVAINSNLQEASKTNDLQEKKKIYQETFSLFLNSCENISNPPPELQSLFFNFLETYSAQILYNQTINNDDEEGFHRAAKLMEFSLLLQLKKLNLIDQNHILLPTDPCYKEKNIEDLIQNLTYGGLFDTFFEDLNINPQVLAKAAKDNGFQKDLSKALIRLSYCYQNMSKEHKNAPLQFKLQNFTEQVIGYYSESIEQKHMFIDYLYNRCSYLAGLRYPGEEVKKIESYDQVLLLLAECYSPDDRAYLGKKSQILNMTALIAIKGELTTLIDAERRFREALNIRSELIASATDAADLSTQKYFRANILTGVIHCLAERPVIDEATKKELIAHRQTLLDHMLEMISLNNNNSYSGSWLQAIEKATKAINSAKA